MNAEILSIGTELLIGQVVNTNATWLAQQLARLGIDLHRVVTVGDNMDRLCEAIAATWERADLVLCTGGLGPTPDDITVAAVARVLGEPLRERPEVLEHIRTYFARRGRQVTALDRKQSEFPPSAELIPNPAGTACGLCAKRGGRQLMAFPGVPSELQVMWETWAEPRLAGMAGASIRSVLLKFAGCSEAELAELVADLLGGRNPTVAPYTCSGEIHLRLTAKAGSPDAAAAALVPLESEILGRAGGYYFGRDEATLPSVVGERLRRSGQTLAVGESATGGLLASRITDVPGASDYFRGGVVAYSTAAKVGALGVSRELIERYGAVSREVTEALAQGARTVLGADWGVGTTGWAGPGPGAPAPDIGLMHVSVASPAGGVASREFRHGSHPRDLVKYFATQRALHLLLRRLEHASGS